MACRCVWLLLGAAVLWGTTGTAQSLGGARLISGCGSDGLAVAGPGSRPWASAGYRLPLHRHAPDQEGNPMALAVRSGFLRVKCNGCRHDARSPIQPILIRLPNANNSQATALQLPGNSPARAYHSWASCFSCTSVSQPQRQAYDLRAIPIKDLYQAQHAALDSLSFYSLNQFSTRSAGTR
jgi:hypothetical protein